MNEKKTKSQPYAQRLDNRVESAPEIRPVSMNLVNTEKIAMLVKYCLVSQYIEREIAPLSLFLIAPSEHNKTRILLTFKNFPNTTTVESISAKPLSDLIKNQDGKQTVHHLIILDFIRTLQMKYTVSDAVTGYLLNLVDEGVKHSMFYGQEYELKRRIQMGIITSVTPDLFRKHFIRWNQNGQITRYLFCSYVYSQSTHNEINDYISQDLPVEIDNAIAKVKRRGIKDIKLDNSDIASAVEILSENISQKLKKFHITRTTGKTRYPVYLNMEGFRLHKMLRLLIKSIAYDAERDVVNYEDLLKLKQLSEYINLPDNPKEV